MIEPLAECILLVNRFPDSDDKRRLLYLLSLLLAEVCKNGQDQRVIGIESEGAESKG